MSVTPSTEVSEQKYNVTSDIPETLETHQDGSKVQGNSDAYLLNPNRATNNGSSTVSSGLTSKPAPKPQPAPPSKKPDLVTIAAGLGLVDVGTVITLGGLMVTTSSLLAVATPDPVTTSVGKVIFRSGKSTMALGASMVLVGSVLIYDELK